MKPAENIKKLIQNVSIKTNPKVNKAVLNSLFDELDKSKKADSAALQPNIWRIIMKSSITKLAVAAVLVIAAVISVTLLNKSVTPAYAFEQTIEVLKNTRTVHMFCRDWDGKKFEMWMTLDSQGYPEYCYSYWPDYEVTNISTPTVSYQYNKKMNQVSVNKGKLYHFGDVQFDRMFEDLQKEVQKSESNVKVYREAASSGGKNLIVAISENGGWKIFIDPDTKLPVGLHCLKDKNQPGDFIKDFDEILFDEELPAGIFEFQIPEGATVSDIDDEEKRLSDPNNGISTEGLTEQQAAEQIAGQYWQAIIAKDFEKVKKLSPGTNASYSNEEVEKKYQKYFGDYFPSEYVESGKLYVEHNCGLGKVLPCILKFENGRKKEMKIIIKFRNIDGKSSCVIAGHFGYPVEID
jgi:hypothetical protein